MRKPVQFGFVGLVVTAGCGVPATVARPTGPAASPVVSVAPIARGIDESIGLMRDPRIAAALADVDPAQIRRTDSALVSFGTRNTFSDTMSSTHGIGAARRWLYAQLDGYSRACGGCLKVEYYGKVNEFRRVLRGDTTTLSANVVDVVAWLPGRDTSRVVVLTGHYDSCVCSAGGAYDSTSTAPGADDDGSGTSAIVELARVFSKRFPKGLDATIIFAAVGAEEQGLNGSRQLAERLHDAGYTIAAGMTDDIVGNVTAEDGTTDSTSMRIFAADPDNSPSRELGRYTWALDRVYLPSFEVLPVWRLDRIGRGGDHEPYVNLGDAGLRFTERLENYNRQHLPTDDFAHVNFGYVANVARVNAITVASLAAAPATPANARAMRQARATDSASASSGGQAWTVSWQPSAGAESYELLIRDTTAPTWERVIPLGNVTRCTLRRQLDDEWAGVRAVGAGGVRSMAASMPAPRVPAGTRGAPGSRGAAPQAAAGRGRGGQPAGPPPPTCGS
ncbi:MAG: M20/M25/M40 family metallo-hydrolase [Gemmatimonadales bacterium]